MGALRPRSVPGMALKALRVLTHFIPRQPHRTYTPDPQSLLHNVQILKASVTKKFYMGLMSNYVVPKMTPTKKQIFFIFISLPGMNICMFCWKKKMNKFDYKKCYRPHGEAVQYMG